MQMADEVPEGSSADRKRNFGGFRMVDEVQRVPQQTASKL